MKKTLKTSTLSITTKAKKLHFSVTCFESDFINASGQGKAWNTFTLVNGICFLQR